MADLTVLNGPPSAPTSLTVGTTAVELKVGANRLSERRVVIVQPINYDIYWCYRDTDNSTAAPTTANAFKIFKGQWMQIECSDLLAIWLVAAQDTDVRIQEVG